MARRRARSRRAASARSCCHHLTGRGSRERGIGNTWRPCRSLYRVRYPHLQWPVRCNRPACPLWPVDGPADPACASSWPSCPPVLRQQRRADFDRRDHCPVNPPPRMRINRARLLLVLECPLKQTLARVRRCVPRSSVCGPACRSPVCRVRAPFLIPGRPPAAYEPEAGSAWACADRPRWVLRPGSRREIRNERSPSGGASSSHRHASDAPSHPPLAQESELSRDA